MTEQERVHKFRKQDGETPSFRALHEVHITKKFNSIRNQDIHKFANGHIGQFNGQIEEKTGMPMMLFEHSKDAEAFADELSAKLKIPREHIEIKAQK
ncbi:MAG: hypothetical protein WCF70_12280 [Dehalococcoidales bacterium]